MNLRLARRCAYAATALAAIALAAPASAALSATGLACDASCVYAAFSPTPLACSGAWTGNDANQQADLLAQVATDFESVVGAGATYTWLGKSDDAGSGPFASNPTTTGGTLTFDTAQTGFFAVSLKAGNAFSVYLFDGGAAGLTSIDFTTLGVQVNGQGNAADLSHAALISVTPVPEPTALALMLAGLGGIGAVVRRRTQR